jgi:hypothetical protein
MRSYCIELKYEIIETGLLLQEVHTSRPSGFGLEGEGIALMAPVLWRISGLDRLDLNAHSEPSDHSLERLKRPLGLENGAPLSDRVAFGRPGLFKEAIEGGTGADGFDGGLVVADQDEAAGLVGDGERIALAAVAQCECALEIRAPEVVGPPLLSDNGAPWARCRRRPMRATKPWRSRTQRTVLIAGSRTSPGSRRPSHSRILRARQWRFSPLSRTIKASIWAGSGLASCTGRRERS